MATSEKLQALICSHLDQVATFAELANHSLGAWPSDVMHALITLSDLDRRLSGRVEALMSSVATPYVGDNLARTVLPDEHPLDFDWRFHPATSEMLIDRVISGLGATEKIL